LLGLGHVGQHDLHGAGLNEPQASGVTRADMEDVMGKGSVRHNWHAGPWKAAAASLTETNKDDWHVFMKHHGHHILPVPMGHGHHGK
jgi:hypothetical protein